jgi:hypothetical protein
VYSSLLEIIQLANGDIVLKRADDEGEPLVKISFSAESKAHIGESGIDVARAMIQAGVEAAALINEEAIREATFDGDDFDAMDVDIDESALSEEGIDEILADEDGKTFDQLVVKRVLH